MSCNTKDLQILWIHQLVKIPYICLKQQKMDFEICTKMAAHFVTKNFNGRHKTRNLPHSGWYPQTETWYHERPINEKSWNKVRNLAWILCFRILPQKFKVQNCRHFLQRKRKILFKLGRVHYLDTMWVESFYEIALPFLKILWKVLSHFGGLNFRQNCSIPNG